MSLPVLIVLHQEHSTPGRVGNALRSRGFPLDIRRPRFDEPLPDTLENHAGAVIFGGPQSANDKDDFIRREIDWLKVPLKEKKPFLGICLGAQMLARQLGAKVLAAPAWPRRGRLLPDPPDIGGPRALQGLARSCLPVAPRGLRAAARRGVAGGG